jgi:hypothetical protein
LREIRRRAIVLRQEVQVSKDKQRFLDYLLLCSKDIPNITGVSTVGFGTNYCRMSIQY